MSSITIRKANLSRLKTDVIVISANEQLTPSPGASATIFKEAGAEQLAAECAAKGRCKTGDAVITGAGSLEARWLVHAVAPAWKDGRHKEPQQLSGCYRRALELAVEQGAKSIGVPLLSIGLKYPKDKAWRKALQTCNDFLEEHPELDLEITFAIRGDEMLEMGQKELDRQRKARERKRRRDAGGAPEEDNSGSTPVSPDWSLCVATARALDVSLDTDSDDFGPVGQAMLEDMLADRVVLLPYSLPTIEKNAHLDLDEEEETEDMILHYLDGPDGMPWYGAYLTGEDLPRGDSHVRPTHLSALLQSLFVDDAFCYGAYLCHRRFRFEITHDMARELLQDYEDLLEERGETGEDEGSSNETGNQTAPSDGDSGEPPYCLDLASAISAFRSTGSDNVRPVHDALLRDLHAGNRVCALCDLRLDPQDLLSGKVKDLQEGKDYTFHTQDDSDGHWLLLYTSKAVVPKDSGSVIITPLGTILREIRKGGSAAGVIFDRETCMFRLGYEEICQLLEFGRLRTQDEIDLDIGANAYQAGDFETAVRYYQKAATACNPTAISNLGYCHYYGRSIPVDKEKARLCWEKAAILGDPAATYKLGDMYRNGDLPRDIVFSRALYWRALNLMGDNKDPMLYPDICMRLLRHCAKELSPDQYRTLARDAVLGFRTRMEDGDPYTSRLYQESLAILQEVDDIP